MTPPTTDTKAITTPSKRRRTANADGPSTPSKKAKKSSGQPTPISTSKATLSSEDRLLIKLKDEDGKTWSDITEFFSELNGKTYDGSTFRKRYQRLKENLTDVAEDDLKLLLKVKREADAKIDEEIRAIKNKLWQIVAEELVNAGGTKYPPGALEKAWKRAATRVSVDED
jgi:hypothetical protein